MTKQYYVYIHAKPKTNDIHGIFYVGKGLASRVIDMKKRNKYHARIVKKYGVENIIIRKLSCKSESDALRIEIEMIAALKRVGVQLSNLTDGGEGMSNPSEELRARLSFYAKNRPPEVIDKMSAAAKVRKASKQTREKISESLRLRPPISEKTRAKLSAANRNRGVEINANFFAAAKNPSEQTRAKISASSKGLWKNPEYREKISAVHRGKIVSEETRAKLSPAAKLRPTISAETREKNQHQ